jgi:arginine exporter protein ArgO
MHPSTQGLLIGVLISIPTGPVGILCIRRAFRDRYIHAITSALGSIVADIVFGCIAIFSITHTARFFVSHQSIFQTVGGTLLVIVGARALRRVAMVTPEYRFQGIRHFASTFLLTLTNPVQLITLPIVFGAFGTGVRQGNYNDALMFLFGLFVGASTIWFLLIGGVRMIRERMHEEQLRWIDKTAAFLILFSGIIMITIALAHSMR